MEKIAHCVKKLCSCMFIFLSLSCSVDQKIILKNFSAVQNYQNKNYVSAIEKFYALVYDDSVSTEKEKSIAREYAAYNLALSYMQMGEWQSALEKFSKLDDAQSEKIKSYAFFQMGLIYFKNKNYKAALENFRNAITAKDDFIEAKINYEICLKLLNKNDEEKEQDKKTVQSKSSESVLEYINKKETKLWESKEGNDSENAPYDY